MLSGGGEKCRRSSGSLGGGGIGRGSWPSGSLGGGGIGRGS